MDNSLSEIKCEENVGQSSNTQFYGNANSHPGSPVFNPCTSNRTTEYFSNNISTPSKNMMECVTPVQNLLKSFSPTTAKCIEKGLDFNQPIDFKFMKSISPHFMMNFVSKLREIDDEECVRRDNYTEGVDQDGGNEKENAEYYPGSMLRGNLEEFTNSPSVLENYLNQNAEEEKEEKEDVQKEEENPYGVNLSSSKYVEETISSSYQSIWQNMNNYGFHCPQGNMLAPVMLSSYQEMVALQNELQNMNGENGDHFVLPIFFQPYQMPPQYTDSNEGGNKSVNGVEDLSKENETREQKTFTTLTAMGDKSTDVWSNYEDDELLRKCRLACMEAEGFVEHGENSEGRILTITTTSLPTTSMHNDSMKYLEEAALKLLQSSTRKQPTSRKRYQRKGFKGVYQCDVCDKTFNRLFTLTTHERVHTGSKPYQCEFCNQTFRQSGTKRNHIRAVHAKEKPYKCDYCPKLFGHKSSLVVHRRIHTKEKPYQCTECGRKFTDRATFKKHDAIHTREKKFKCGICGKCLTQHSNLKRHIKTMHKNHKSNIEQKNHHILHAIPKIESQ